MARHLEIAESTWHCWVAQYGGMKLSDAKRLKELEGENARLKRSWPRPRLSFHHQAGGDLRGLPPDMARLHEPTQALKLALRSVAQRADALGSKCAGATPQTLWRDKREALRRCAASTLGRPLTKLRDSVK